MEMVEEWKKGRRTEGEGEGPGKKVGGHEETARDARKSESDVHMCRGAAEGRKVRPPPQTSADGILQDEVPFRSPTSNNKHVFS